MPLRSQNGASVFACGSINDGGKVERASLLHRELCGIDRIISLFCRETLRSRRRLDRTPEEFPAFGTGKDLDRQQVLPLLHRKKDEMIGCGNRRFLIAFRHRRIDQFAVEVDLHVPVRPEPDGDLSIDGGFELVVEHRGIRVTLARGSGFQTQIDFALFKRGRRVHRNWLHRLLLDSGQFGGNCVKRLDRGIDKPEQRPFLRKRRLNRFDVAQIEQNHFGERHFAVQFADVEREHGRIFRIVTLQSGNDFNEKFLFPPTQRNPFDEPEVFRFSAHPVGDHNRTGLRLFTVDREVKTVRFADFQIPQSLLKFQQTGIAALLHIQLNSSVFRSDRSDLPLHFPVRHSG